MSVRYVRLTELVSAKQGNLVLLSGRAGDVQTDSERGLYFQGHQTEFDLANRDVLDRRTAADTSRSAASVKRLVIRSG